MNKHTIRIVYMSESNDEKNRLVNILKPLVKEGAKIHDYAQGGGFEGFPLVQAARRDVAQSDIVIVINPRVIPCRQSVFWAEVEEAKVKRNGYAADHNPVLVIGSLIADTEELGTPFSLEQTHEILSRIRQLIVYQNESSTPILHPFLQHTERWMNDESKALLQDFFRKNKGVEKIHIFRLADRQPGKIPWDLAHLSSSQEEQASDILIDLMPRTMADHSTNIEYSYSVDRHLVISPTDSSLLASTQIWLNSQLRDHWREIVTDSFGDLTLFSGGQEMRIFPLKCVNFEANRDIVAFLLCSAPKGKINRTHIRNVLAPLMRYQTVAKMRYDLKAPSLSRQRIQHICLDACLTLTGCDWGCIKTSCVSSHGPASEEHVAAECVFHCPVFYREGAFPTGDDKISGVLRAKRSQIVVFDKAPSNFQQASSPQSHPAKAAYVAILPSRSESFDGIENEVNPRLRAAAFVMQHTDVEYLKKSVSINKELIEQVTRRYIGAIDLISYRAAYESTQRIRHQLSKLDSTESPGDLIESTMRDLLRSSIDDCLPGIHCAHSLVWWDAQFNKSPCHLLSSESTQSFFSDILGFKLWDTASWPQTLLFRSCNNRSPYVLQVRAGESTSLTLYRRIEHQFHMPVVFYNPARQMDGLASSTCVVQEWSPIPREVRVSSISFDLAVVPLVSSDGLTVGCICICAGQASLKDQHLDDLLQHAGVGRLSRILYQLRHKMKF